MFTKTKKRLIYFETDGNVQQDFSASRQKKSDTLRKIINFCFYAQSVAAISCAVVGVTLSEELFGRVFAAVAAVCVIAVAFFALGGHNIEKTASYILNFIYAITSFFAGGMALITCGILLTLAGVAGVFSFFAGYFRDYLLSYPAQLLRAGRDYKLTKQLFTAPPPKKNEPEPPKKQEKSELMEVAEQLMEILK